MGTTIKASTGPRRRWRVALLALGTGAVMVLAAVAGAHLPLRLSRRSDWERPPLSPCWQELTLRTPVPRQFPGT